MTMIALGLVVAGHVQAADPDLVGNTLITTGGPAPGGVNTATEARISGGGGAFAQQLVVGIAGNSPPSTFYGNRPTTMPQPSVLIGGGMVWASSLFSLSDGNSGVRGGRLSVADPNLYIMGGWLPGGAGVRAGLKFATCPATSPAPTADCPTQLEITPDGVATFYGPAPTTVGPDQVRIGGGYIWSASHQINFLPKTDIPFEIVNRQATGGLDLYPNGTVLGLRIKTTNPGFTGAGVAGIGGGHLATAATSATTLAESFVYDESGQSYLGLVKRGSANTGNLGLPAGSAELISYKAPLGILTFGGAYPLSFGTNNTEAMRIEPSQNVVIGTGIGPVTSKLTVYGKISAQEIKVTTTGADYVFDSDYKLRSLAEVEQFITKEKHLPEMMSAKDMQADGLPVSEVVTKQLAKIEELTLYVIALNREKAVMAERLDQQAQMMSALDLRLKSLETK